MGYKVPPASSGSFPGSPTRGTSPVVGRQRGYPNQMPKQPQLIPFDAEEQRAHFELPLDDGLILRGNDSHPLLHTRQQIAPVHSGSHRLKKPTEPHHPQKAKIRS
ncbi:hypothetical protein ATANTOWER_008423 [Ataeniobius toweri]|uniref:Uncharacterized protein n=1 Tax=Ataeniobius toweri TaxID=208326 RepID=A0ABU7AWS4_9TELE|nr:hypothetical protein [Ataeniobius toweri]